ncbi:hypothetical protein L3Y34_016465 [Caenorhabditis briggsae]|uniref:Uncharacterized protein n=1 Tax=Caenorhabditis briggsae TaxID=6238 RepID=A0AAE9J147_CAEBR|nr:hypothetical protein L3Y34_016465 [Caenorhabditis briggsae]
MHSNSARSSVRSTRTPPKNSYKFATCDVKFWKNEDQNGTTHGRTMATHATWRGKETLIDEPMEETVPQQVKMSSTSSGAYSVSNARGNEHTRDVQQEIQRTFYTVVTRPQRLLDEYEAHEVYTPSRSTSKEPESALARRRDSTIRVSVRSEGAANGQIRQPNNSMAGVSLTLPRVKNHTIRASDTVPVVRVTPGRAPSKVETSHVVTGSLTRQLQDVSGKSVVRDSKSGKTMAPTREGPGKVTYQYKVNASERRVEYRYQSETLLYDFEETTKREQLETWQSKRRVQAPTTAVVTMVRKTQSLQEKADFQELLGTRRREI